MCVGGGGGEEEEGRGRGGAGVDGVVKWREKVGERSLSDMSVSTRPQCEQEPI